MFAAKAIFKTQAEEMQRQHWLNTRAVVQSMAHAHRGSRSRSTGRRSRSLPPSQHMRNESARSSTSSQSAQGRRSTPSQVQPVRGAASKSQSQPQHVRSEGPQFSHPPSQPSSHPPSHPPHEHNVQNVVSQASSSGNSGACSSRNGGLQQRTSQGPLSDSEDSTSASVCLDGDWEMVWDDPDVETWLKRFSIRGAVVEDGVGQVLRLTRNQQNRICLEGGVLVLEKDVLHRIGKSGKTICFRRCRQKASPS